MPGLVVPDSGAYQLVLVAHLVAVIVGFGGLLLARTTALPASVVEGRVEWFAYAVPVLGVLLVMLSQDRWRFGEPWIGASFLIYVAAIGIHQGVLRPSRSSAADPGPAPGAARRTGRVRAWGVVFDLLVVTAVALMVVKPGA